MSPAPTGSCCRDRAPSPTARAGSPPSPACARRSSSATDAGTPFLGICVGMQLMAERGLEHEITPGFGWIGGEIAEMDAPGLRLPQMGWNALDFVPGSHKLLDGLTPGDHVYFVHSYALVGGDPREAIAMTDYGGPVVAMVARRQSGRHAVPRREEPGGRHPHPQQLPALDALTRWPTTHRRCRHSAWSSASPNSPTTICTRCARRPRRRSSTAAASAG